MVWCHNGVVMLGGSHVTSISSCFLKSIDLYIELQTIPLPHIFEPIVTTDDREYLVSGI